METVEICEEESATMPKHTKLAIEEYLSFAKYRDLQLTATQLRQIIGMHGFKRYIGTKSILSDVVKTMDLMDLRRSTLNDGGVSAGSCLTLKEVISDLKSLEWQECHITSVITYGATASASSATSCRADSVKEKTSKASGKKSVDVAAGGSVTSTTTVAAGSTTTGSVKGETPKVLGKKMTKVAGDGTIVSAKGTTAAAGITTTGSLKGKISNVLGKKTSKVAAIDSIINTTGTAVAAKGTATISVAADDSTISTTTMDTAVAAESTTADSVKLEKPEELGKKMIKVVADDSIFSTMGGDDSIISTTGTTVAAKSTAVPVKGKKSAGFVKKPVGVGADDSIVSNQGTTFAAGSTTVSAKGTTVVAGGTTTGKRPKGLGVKTDEVAADRSGNTATGTAADAGSITALGKRKRMRGLGMKPVEVAVDNSTSTAGTTDAAGSTTEGQ